jgi:TatA/E family protein of Tat protein translocase
MAFLDSPIQLMVLLVVLLVLFGPQKLPEIGQQLGRAIRDLKRATSELTNSINSDERYDSSSYTPPNYTPPSYDSYSSTYDSGYSKNLPDAETWHPDAPELPPGEPEGPRGDYAAAALADTAADYGVATGAPSYESGGPEAHAAHPEGTVPRSG